MTFTYTGARRLARTLAAFAATWALSGAAQAQTITLTDAADTMLRGGSYASTNYGRATTLATRASTNDEYKRRVLLKFDTHSTITAGASIGSAKLTLTVRGGNSESRTLSAYRVSQPYTDVEANWKVRRTSTSWSSAGGDMAERIGQATVTSVVGSKVTYDVTGVVQKIVSGAFGSSRYLRVLVVDEGASTSESFKEFYSMEAGSGRGPTLAVVLGTSSTPPPPAPAPAPSGTLKVLHWNLHHGVGTDGKYDLDRIATWIAKINPDVISLNEVERYTGYGNEDQPARYAALLKAKTGKTWYYSFSTYNGQTNASGNMVMSVYPLDSKTSLLLIYDRTVSRATMTVGSRTLNVFSTHLDDDSGSQRAAQMDQLKSWASGFAEQRIIAGDFNTYPSLGELPRMTGTYYDAWAEAVNAGTAVAYSGNTNGATRNNRIDYIFYSKGATGLVLKSARVYDVRDASGIQPSDHRPLLATFEIR
jgi:endonuclease/exonuclease/phosphatase family metal-dependent hydrolase